MHKEQGRRRVRKRAGKKKRIVSTILLILLVIFLGRCSATTYEQYRLSKQKAELVNQLAEENIKTEELKEELKNSDSRSYIEYLARKYLGLIYPDEKMYVTENNEKEEK